MTAEKPFVYGMAVTGVNFTDREKERKRLKLNFENGINVTLISQRRMGKTSLVKQVISEITDPRVKVIYMDIYDCRSEYDFYNKYATAILKSTSGKMETMLEDIKKFLVRPTPKISFEVPDTEFSISLGITPQNYSPEEILNLPERIAREKGISIVVCIDEFQQIGEFPDSLYVQKRLRGAWQHHQNVSFCLFGSKKHLLEKIFQNKRMPFYMFGEMMQLGCIPTEYWVPFICERFEAFGKRINPDFAREICGLVENYSSYVQQLSWNVMTETETEVTEESVRDGYLSLMEQCHSLFVQQTEPLTSYQLNFLRLISLGIHSGFGSIEMPAEYPIGTKSNVARIKRALLNAELIVERRDGVYFADRVFADWFARNMMS